MEEFQYVSLITGICTTYDDIDRVPINITPTARDRLRQLLFTPELLGVGYSAFINRACEAAETEIAYQRRQTR